MGQVWLAFQEGIRRTLRFWQILVISYAASIITTLPLVIFPAINLAQSADRISIQEAADGIDAWLIFESLLGRVRDMTLGESSLAAPNLTDGILSTLLFGLIAAGAIPLLVWISTAFLSGGVLLVYNEAEHSFLWRRFLWGCWHWFGVFLLLGLIQGLLGVFALTSFVIFGFLLTNIAWGLGILVIALFVLVSVSGLVIFEMTRLAAVAGNTRNLWRMFQEAFRFILGQFRPLAGLYLLALGLLAVIHGGFRLGILEAIPPAWWPLALVSQQVFILLRVWARGIRLAGSASLVCMFPRSQHNLHLPVQPPRSPESKAGR